MPYVDKRTLHAIQSADPDGGETEPTDSAYAAHKAWAIATFGPAAWAAYNNDGWDDPADGFDNGDTSHLF